jgi:hypothetical protein
MTFRNATARVRKIRVLSKRIRSFVLFVSTPTDGLYVASGLYVPSYVRSGVRNYGLALSIGPN